MTTDTIVEVEIDDAGRLLVKPKKLRFEYIWRSASEVHWDDARNALYSPKPREWSYYDWWRQILSAVEDEYGCTLTLAENPRWINIPEELVAEINHASR